MVRAMRFWVEAAGLAVTVEGGIEGDATGRKVLSGLTDLTHILRTFRPFGSCTGIFPLNWRTRYLHGNSC